MSSTIAKSDQGQLPKFLALLLSLVAILTFGGLNRIFGISLPIQESLAVVVFGIIFIIGIMFKNTQQARRFPPTQVIIFLSYVLISVTWSAHFFDGLLKLFGYLTMIGAAWVLARHYTALTLLKPIYLTLCAVAIVSLVVTQIFPEIFKTYTLRSEGVWIGLYSNKQSFAFSASFLILLAIIFAWYERSWRHILVALGGVVILLGADSRGALLYLCIVLMLCTFGLMWKALRPLISRLIILIPMFVFVVLAIMIIDDLDYLPWINDDSTLNNRTVIWNYTFPVISNNLIFGTGFNGFWSSLDYVAIFLSSHGWVLEDYHNGFLSVLVECGIVGVGLFILFVAKVSRGLPTNDKWFMNLLIMLFFMVLNVTESFIFKMTSGITFTFFLIAFRLALEATPYIPQPLRQLKSA